MVGSSLYLIYIFICASLHLCILAHATPPFAQDVAPFLLAGTEHEVALSITELLNPQIVLPKLLSLDASQDRKKDRL